MHLKNWAWILFFFFFASLAWGQSASQAKRIRNTLGDFFQIYLIKKERRSPKDRVIVRRAKGGGYVAEIAYWRNIKSRNTVQVLCDAYDWLLFGRGVYGKGVAEAFSVYPSLKQVNLQFYDIEFTTKVGKKRGVILPSQRVIPYLRIGIKKRSLKRKKLNWNAIKAKLKKRQCAEVGNQYFDLKWFDKKYLKKSS